MFAICFTDQCLTTLKQSFSLFPPRKLLIGAVNSSIAQSHCCISNDVKPKRRSLSRKFHGEMRLFASALAKPMKICVRLFLFDKPIKSCVGHFCLRSVFTFIFQGHRKVALSSFPFVSDFARRFYLENSKTFANMGWSLPLSVVRTWFPWQLQSVEQ